MVTSVQDPDDHVSFSLRWETGRTTGKPGFGDKHSETYTDLGEAVKFARMRAALPEFKHVQLLQINTKEVDYTDYGIN